MTLLILVDYETFKDKVKVTVYARGELPENNLSFRCQPLLK